MKIKNKIIDNKGFYIFSAILIASFIFLTYIFPYSLDDWAWSGEIGQYRLDTWFDNYNGRYLGNLFIILISKNNIIKTLLMTATYYLLCYLPYKCAKTNKLAVFVFSTLMFFCLSKLVFIQSIVWASGYTNYVLPMLTIFLYYLIVKDVFGDVAPFYKPISLIPAFLLGFAGCLFMENLTIYTVFCSVALIVYSYIKFKKIFLNHIMYFAGNLLGAYTMFSNAAYNTISNGGDSYRSTPQNLSELIDKIFDNSKAVLYQFFYQNMLALAICSLLSVVLVVLAYKTLSKRVRIISLASVFVNLLSLGVFYLKYKTDYWQFFYKSEHVDKLTTLVFAAFVMMYFLSHLFNIVIAIKGEKRRAAIFALFSIAIVIAPLLVVSPVSARCFYPPYLMLHFLCVILFSCLLNSVKIGSTGTKVIIISMLSAIVAFVFFYASMYLIIHHYDLKRSEYIEKQLANGENTIVCCRLPYEPFVHGGYPGDNELWKERYKMYFGIESDQNVEYKTCLEFDKWAEEYDKEISK